MNDSINQFIFDFKAVLGQKKIAKSRWKLIFFFAFFISTELLADAFDPSINQTTKKHGEFYPYWPQGTFEWIYHPQNEPEWLGPDQGLELFKNAALAWKECGLKIEFKGIAPRANIKLGDKVNAFGWGQLSASTRAITYRVMEKNSPVIKEADIFVNSDNRDIQKNATLLQKVITHEFGHALGLLHPQSCDDVMSSASECGKKIANPPPLSPSENDLLQCQLRYKP